MSPKLNPGEYVFCTIAGLKGIELSEIIGLFREDEAITIIIKKEIADHLHLPYTYVAAWITLTVHSSLAGVGFTAAFSTALAAHLIGCNVVAAYYHDHIFVDQKDAEKAVKVLEELSGKS